MIREIVKIDEELCDGCGLCIPNCHEGALQIIDGKARLVSDLMCDGLGACLGHCPLEAITIEKREAEAYNEVKVMEDMINKGKNTVIAHLQHLKDHDEKEFLKEGVQFLLNNQEKLNFDAEEVLEAVHNHQHPQQEADTQACGCAGSATKTFGNAPHQGCGTTTSNQASALSHWPIQMHLINPTAGHFRKSDFVLAADCVAFSLGSFHPDFLQGKTLAIACPKLDQGTDIYVQKIKSLIDDSEINTLTVMVMEVPCCNGLLQITQMAMDQATRRVPIKRIVVSVEGQILHEEWV